MEISFVIYAEHGSCLQKLFKTVVKEILQDLPRLGESVPEVFPFHSRTEKRCRGEQIVT